MGPYKKKITMKEIDFRKIQSIFTIMEVIMKEKDNIDKIKIIIKEDRIQKL